MQPESDPSTAAQAAQPMEAALGLLFDDPEFHQLDRRLAGFNLFEAVGGVRAELRHSNFLAFLLSPTRPHGFGSKILEQITRSILDTIPAAERPLRSLELALADLDDAIVHRERDNIDLLIELASLRLAIVIENKIGAGTGENQLARYKAVVEQRLPSYRHLLVFLTPDGLEPDCEGWVPFSYRTLAQLLATLADSGSGSDGSNLILTHYTEMLRRHVVPDEDLRELALKLYERHREAFDFVIATKPEPKTILDNLRTRILAVSGLVEDKSHATIVRFAPERWDTLEKLRCDPSLWTKSGRGLLFEAKIHPATSRVHVSLILGPCDGAVRTAFYMEVLQRSAFRGVTKPLGRSWTTIHNRELLTPAQAAGLDFEQRLTSVALSWSDFQGTELSQLIAEVEAVAAHI